MDFKKLLEDENMTERNENNAVPEDEQRNGSIEPTLTWMNKTRSKNGFIIVVKDDFEKGDILLGGIAAFVMPDMLHYTYYHYRFYNFVLIHVGIMIVPLYYYKAYNYEVKLKSMYRIYLFLLVIAPIIILANFLLDKNYMFIGQKPDIIAKYLPEWPYFILVYLLIILVLFHALYLVMHFREITSSLKKMQKKMNVKKSYIKK